MPKKILILCTGNSCRSQMAAGFLKSIDGSLEVHSAGTAPAARVHPMAIAAMAEAGVDISGAVPRNVREFLHQPFDFVITVCGDARETCPAFTGIVRERIHSGFRDPAEAGGTDEERMRVFREVREEIRLRMAEFATAASSGRM
jgi:arsenate reductase